MRSKNLLKCLLVVLSLTFAGMDLMGQGVTTSSISGRVVDETGEGTPGANVVAIHISSGSRYGASTRLDGRFNLRGLRTGEYSVEVSFVGYETKKYDGILLALGQNYDLDVSFEAASTELSEIVITSGRGEIIDKERTGASTNISNKTLTDLPTINRSLDDFTRLTPQFGGGGFAGQNQRFNNVTIDGSIFNNSFGLSSSIGGQTGSQPISLDAIEEVQVNIAPYDVTQGAFSGAGISAITRSGTNEWSGSAYGFTRTPGMTSNRVGEVVDDERDEFSYYQAGFRVGGPIIKDKLFMFLSYEGERESSPFTQFRPRQAGETPGGNISRVLESDMNQLSQFLVNEFGYNPGPFQNYDRRTESDKITLRLDYNINESNKLIFRYNRLNSFRDNFPSASGSLGGRSPSQNSLPFQAAYYQQYNNMNSFILELNSTINNNLTNNFTIGYNGLRDFRDSDGGIFPLVDILQDNQTYTTFGFEAFSAFNQLDSDILQISDNLTYYTGDHALTIGTHNEFYSFRNGFLPFAYGYYRFNSLDDFYTSVNDGVSNASLFRQAFNASDPEGAPIVEWSAMQLGFYIQDQWDVTRNLRLTTGLRIDVPVYLDAGLLRNEAVEDLQFRDGQTLRTDVYPSTQILWSPRVGFNWDVNGDGKTQIRGGSGLFAGRPPFVWVSNQASNNGILSGTEFSPDPTDRPFSPDVNAYRPEAGSGLPTAFNLAILADDFKFPQVWRSNLAVDQVLPGGIIATLEGIYTRDVNNVMFQNVNLPESAGRFSGADNRPFFESGRINNNITDAVLLTNVSDGYYYGITGSLMKSFPMGLDVMMAYTYADARNRFSGGGSIANSAWRGQGFVEDPNMPELGYAQFFQQHRIIASVSYKKEYAKFMGTTISMFAEGGPAGRNTFFIGNSDPMVGAATGGNTSLIYVPTQADFDNGSFVIVDTDNATAQQQWNALNAFIEDDRHLSSRRGDYMLRNGSELPWAYGFDFRVLQDFYINVAGRRNTIQVSLDVFNFGNFLSPFWGINQQFAQANNLYDFVGFADGSNNPQVGAENLPTYTVNTGLIDNPSNLRDNLGLASRWRAQVGLRYIF